MTRDEALEILGLDVDASLDEAGEAYGKLVEHYHPNTNTASNAAVMFRLIQDAWKIIQNDIELEQDEAEARRKEIEELTSLKEESGSVVPQVVLRLTKELTSLKEEFISLKEENEKRVENKIRWYFMIVWVAAWVISPKIITGLPELSGWPRLAAIALGLVLSEVIVKVRRWFKME